MLFIAEVANKRGEGKYARESAVLRQKLRYSSAIHSGFIAPRCNKGESRMVAGTVPTMASERDHRTRKGNN